jgi:Protein of unknown function (DUF4031)
VSVYVDDMRAPFRGMLMCHMMADSPDELLKMADRIGVRRKWIQHAGAAREHFDICLAKRALAVAAGAIEVTARELVMRQARKSGEESGETNGNAGPQGTLFGERGFGEAQ